MMMQKEMATMHYKGAGETVLVVLLIIVLALLTIALVLLIVLEIQWIKYWSRVLKAHKSNRSTP